MITDLRKTPWPYFGGKADAASSGAPHCLRPVTEAPRQASLFGEAAP